MYLVGPQDGYFLESSDHGTNNYNAGQINSFSV